MKLSSLSSSFFYSYFIALFFIIILVIFYGKDVVIVLPLQYDQIYKNEKPLPFIINHTTKGCDIFAGKWIYDESTMPHYKEEECPYIQPQLTCQEHGRLDLMYQHWRWQPRDCSLPRFNASLMMEKIRGKRMLYVGDSLNRGQYTSMICLLHRVLPENSKSLETIGSLTVFRAKEYNATIEFYWAPFLVESNSDNAIVHRVKDRLVRIDSIEKHAKHWKGADIIVFNTYVWWMTGRPMNTIKQPFTKDLKIVKMMKTEDVYRLTMKAMLNWVKTNMGPLKTRVFFTSMSPAHESSKEWGGKSDGNCYNQTKPITNPTYWGKFSNKMMMQVIKEEFQLSEVPITLINITQLSEYRKDAHTSIYKKQWNPLTPEQIVNPTSYADCVHWCLPGVQDTWNELVYTKLFFS